jgi:hypothetical protein
VIAIRRKIATQLGRVRFEHAVERVQPFEQHSCAAKNSREYVP